MSVQGVISLERGPDHVCQHTNDAQIVDLEQNRATKQPTQIDMPETSSDRATDLESARTWKDRKPYRSTPHFHELEDIDFSRPGPGTFRFPNDELENGARKPYKELHLRPGILPPRDEPFFVQVQAFCQRWAVWAATIDNDNRRKEVLQWVFTQMVEAWKFGVLNGHYKLGPFEAAEKERLLKESRPSKRHVDMARKAAPFVTEPGNNKDFNIVNSELEKAGISMDMINKRIERNELDEGEVLLQTMTDRLQRNIEPTDWKQNTRFAFKASVHSRNLFMYALWEVQRCRRLIANLEGKFDDGAGTAQKKAWSTRIETNRARSLQHLALAIELNLKDPIDVDSPPLEVDQETEANTEPGSFSRDANAPGNDAKHLQVTADYFSADYSSGTVQDDNSHTSNQIQQNDGEDVAVDTNLPYMDEHMGQDIGPELPDLPEMPELSEFPSSFVYDFPLQESAEKRAASDDAVDIFAEQSNKRPQADHPVFPWQVHEEAPFTQNSESLSTPKFVDPKHVARATLDLTQEQPYDNRESLVAPVLAQLGNHATETTEEKKGRYLAEVWAPKIDVLLQQYGHGHLTQPLKKWSDVRAILINLNLSMAERNAYLREYKNGLVTRGITPKNGQQSVLPEQPQHPKVTLRMPSQVGRTNQYSDRTVNETRGFCFRCLPEASAEQCARLDDLINDYVTEIIAGRYRRHGTYIIMHDPEHPDRMPIAHGFWNNKNKSHVSGASWFYDGRPIPDNSDLEAWHIHDFDRPPPKTPKRTSKRSDQSSCWTEPTATRGGNSSKRTKIRHVRRADARQSRNVNGFYTFDDPDDSDFDPGQW